MLHPTPRLCPACPAGEEKETRDGHYLYRTQGIFEKALPLQVGAGQPARALAWPLPPSPFPFSPFPNACAWGALVKKCTHAHPAGHLPMGRRPKRRARPGRHLVPPVRCTRPCLFTSPACLPARPYDCSPSRWVTSARWSAGWR